MESVLAADLPTHVTAVAGSASLQIDIASGAKKNPQISFESNALFLGSDPQCDLLLDPMHFPPMYAFLLIESHGIVLRHLGGGPDLFVNRQPAQRQRIEASAHVHAGPLSLKLHVTPSTVPRQPRTMSIAAESGSQLIEQASRLLAAIGQEHAEVGTITTSPHHARETAITATNAEHNPLPLSEEVKLSVGLPDPGHLPPAWQHICL
ncbi:MAG: FHA domain-containing protein [Pirellulales bacterium]|nr:FHA domain-containing protein [Pirellulales bacterium]